MKVAFAGRSGTGKTRLTSLFVQYLADRGRRVMAVDAGAGQRLAETLGAPRRPPPLSAHLMEIKEHLRGRTRGSPPRRP